jgi:hypothetical protein
MADHGVSGASPRVTAQRTPLEPMTAQAVVELLVEVCVERLATDTPSAVVAEDRFGGAPVHEKPGSQPMVFAAESEQHDATGSGHWHDARARVGRR